MKVCIHEGFRYAPLPKLMRLPVAWQVPWARGKCDCPHCKSSGEQAMWDTLLLTPSRAGPDVGAVHFPDLPSGPCEEVTPEEFRAVTRWVRQNVKDRARYEALLADELTSRAGCGSVTTLEF